MKYTKEQAQQVLNDWFEFKSSRSKTTKTYENFLNHKFPAMVPGTWYKERNGSVAFYKGDNIETFGITRCNEFIYNACWFHDWNLATDFWTKATDSEIQDVLVSAWERTNPKFDFYAFYVSANELYGYNENGNGGTKLFDNGEWSILDVEKPELSYTISSSWDSKTSTGAVVVLNNDTGFFIYASDHKCETALRAAIASIEKSLGNAKIERIEERCT